MNYVFAAFIRDFDLDLYDQMRPRAFAVHFCLTRLPIAHKLMDKRNRFLCVFNRNKLKLEKIIVP